MWARATIQARTLEMLLCLREYREALVAQRERGRRRRGGPVVPLVRLQMLVHSGKGSLSCVQLKAAGVGVMGNGCGSSAPVCSRELEFAWAIAQ